RSERGVRLYALDPCSMTQSVPDLGRGGEALVQPLLGFAVRLAVGLLPEPSVRMWHGPQCRADHPGGAPGSGKVRRVEGNLVLGGNQCSQFRGDALCVTLAGWRQV